MLPFVLIVSMVLVSVPSLVDAQEMSREEVIRSAVSAGPASITDDAAVIDWSMNDVRAGTNGWTCLPDRAETEGNDPWCIDEPWLDFLHAHVNPPYSRRPSTSTPRRAAGW